MLSAEARQGRWHTMLATSVGSLATIGQFDLVRLESEKLLREAPESEFTAGLITNIRDRSGFIRRTLPTIEDIDRHYPAYDDERILDYVRRFEDPHIKLVLAGRYEEAATQATTELAKEEYAEVCALIGDVDRAAAFLEHDDFPLNRRLGPLMVACISSFRRGDERESLRFLTLILDDDRDPAWPRIRLAAGFLDRLPWGGYPFPDY